jgi:hypothetical protein
MRKYYYALPIVLMLLVGGALSHAQDGKRGSLTAQDYTEIQMLYAQYNHSIDSGDVEGYVALFTPDGSFNNNSGHEGLRTFMKNRNGGTRRHWNTNLLITPTPEGAKGAVYLMFVDVGMKPPAITSAGRYEDSLVKTAQGWRFKQRRNFPDPPAAPASAAAPAPQKPNP